MRKEIGVVLLIVGIGLLMWGFNLYGAFDSQMSRIFRGSPTDKTVIVLVAGAICTALGIMRLTMKK